MALRPRMGSGADLVTGGGPVLVLECVAVHLVDAVDTFLGGLAVVAIAAQRFVICHHVIDAGIVGLKILEGTDYFAVIVEEADGSTPVCLIILCGIATCRNQEYGQKEGLGMGHLFLRGGRDMAESVLGGERKIIDVGSVCRQLPEC